MWYKVSRVVLEAAIVAGVLWGLVLNPVTSEPVELRQIYAEVGRDYVCTFMTTTHGGLAAAQCVQASEFTGGFGTWQESLVE